MKIITKEYVLENDAEVIKDIRSGKIFIYPTDTIYGLGCNALDSEAVNRIREIKKRADKPFSVIAPSKEWISENCIIRGKTEEWIEKLPGAYTLIVELKNNRCIASEVNMNSENIGVRIPEHWFSEIVKKAGVPFVTTSVNVSGEKSMSSIEDIKEIGERVDYIVYEGVKDARASKIIDLRNGEERIIDR